MTMAASPKAGLEDTIATSSATEGQNAFACRVRPWEDIDGRQIFSILSATADKKEMKRIENQALEKVRALGRKAA